MRNALIPLVVLIVGIIPVYADVFVPEDEIVGYFDSNGIYTVVGAVKNTEDYAVLPVLHLNIFEDQKELKIIQQLPVVFPNKDIPFKIKIPEITDSNASIEHFEVAFEKKLDVLPSQVEVVYDRSLTKHSDGHLSGKIINKGNATVYDLKVYATIHGESNSFIDVAKNTEKIDKIEPGQTLEFTMYPDPTLADLVHYYSCFAIGDETIVPLNTLRNGERFDFRYDSTASFVVKGFDETGTKLSILGINSFKFPAYVNFEIPKMSDDEKFEVHIDDKPVKFIQSTDEQGNWHVAFDVEGTTQNKILISGFKNTDSQHAIVGAVPQTVIESDVSYLYYVIPIVFAVMIGLFVYRKTRSAAA